MVRAALDGSLEGADFTTDPVFGLSVPTAIAGVPSEVLTPRGTWSDPTAFDTQARRLAEMFRDNFRAFADQVPEAVVAAGPQG